MADKVKLSKDGTSIDFVASESLPTSLKKFRQSPEIEGFYRFIFENDLQKEAYEILERIINARKAKKAAEKAIVKAREAAEKAALKAKLATEKPVKAKEVQPTKVAAVKPAAKATAKPVVKAAKAIPAKAAKAAITKKPAAKAKAPAKKTAKKKK